MLRNGRYSHQGGSSVPFLILIYQTACPFGKEIAKEIAKQLASPEHPFDREPEQGRC